MTGVASKAVPDNAVSISDASEAPDDARVVQGERGGLYYIPGGGDGEEEADGDDDQDSGGEGVSVPEEWDSIDTVDGLEGILGEFTDDLFRDNLVLDGVTDEMAADYADALGRVSQTGALDRMNIFTTAEEGSENGHWNETRKRMYINPDQVNEDIMASDHEKGWISTEHPAQTILHEAGHALHFGGMSGHQEMLMDTRSFREREGETPEAEIAAEVSDVATQNPKEFVCEVFAGLLNGEAYDDEVMDLYDKLHGPEVPDGE